jgi:signal recognition particle subunit SEC65
MSKIKSVECFTVQELKEELESLGYECKTASQYNEDYYTIGW